MTWGRADRLNVSCGGFKRPTRSATWLRRADQRARSHRMKTGRFSAVTSIAREDAAGSGALVRAMTGGRATLLLGQRHSPGLLDALRQDIAAITGESAEADLVRLLDAVRDDSALEGLRRAFEVHPVAPELIEVAGNPWSFVVTSAIDPQVQEAFQRLGLASRQLRVLFAGKTGTLARSGVGPDAAQAVRSS